MPSKQLRSSHAYTLDDLIDQLQKLRLNLTCDVDVCTHDDNAVRITVLEYIFDGEKIVEIELS